MTAIAPRLPAGPSIVSDGPRMRLGLAWAAVAFVATTIGAVAAGVVFAVAALGAAGQSCRAWRKVEQRAGGRAAGRGEGRGDARGDGRDQGLGEGRPEGLVNRRPHSQVAIGGAVIVALAGSGGFLAVAAAVMLTTAAAVVAQQARLGGKAWEASLTAAVALVPGIAAASVPLARRELGVIPALVLLVTVLLAEASWFLIGSGARTRFDAPVASTAAVIAMSIAVAAVLVPPFRGASPWILGAVAALLMPLGPIAASAVLPRPDAFAPALRRIDGFVLVGPVWTLVAAAILDLR